MSKEQKFGSRGKLGKVVQADLHPCIKALPNTSAQLHRPYTTIRRP